MSVHQLPKATQNGGEPPMDSRIAKLEVAVQYVERDLKELKLDIRDLSNKTDHHLYMVVGMIIALGVGLASAMAKGFGWL